MEDQLSDLRYDKVFAPLVLALVYIVLAALEWTRAYLSLPPNPILYTVVALVGVAYAMFEIWRARPKLRALRLASEGERAVGQFLEQLRERGVRVFHDLQGKGFNVDHVLVGPRGVFTIETKTYSKPGRGEARITFDGESVLIGGLMPDRDCVVQARAQSNWLRELITESTGRKVPVRPAVVFPGWYIDGPPKGKKTDVWVLNPKGLPSFLENERESLSPEDVNLISYHITRYIRAENIS